jgi:putative nucleotidyltransferase with HDIG domain
MPPMISDVKTQVESLVERGLTLPPLPQLGGELLGAMHRPLDRIDMQQLAETVEKDPSMTARLLRVANSPIYGAERNVTRVKQSMVILGLEETMGLLNYYLVRRSFPKLPSFPHFSAEQFWRHSWAVASVARMLGQPRFLIGAMPGELFTAGLLHDLGRMILAVNMPEQWAECLQQAWSEEKTLHELEVEHFGVDHAMLAAQLLDGWNLPPAILDAIACHHDPARADDQHRTLAAMVEFADALVAAADTAPGANPVTISPANTWWCRTHPDHPLSEIGVLSELIVNVRQLLRKQGGALEENDPTAEEAKVAPDARQIAAEPRAAAIAVPAVPAPAPAPPSALARLWNWFVK